MKIFKVSIIGKPNVGKSTLTNLILKKNISIVSHKPQTTRNIIKGLYQEEDFQLLILDTPGYHDPKNKLDLYLNSQVRKSLKEVDGYLFLIDARRSIDDEDIELFNKINTFSKKQIIYVINKIDLVDENTLVDIEQKLKSNFYANEILRISAFNDININILIEKLKSYSHDFEHALIEEEFEQDDKFLISELIREQALHKYRQEVPHSIAININIFKYDKDKNLLKIEADIIVEKDSQKPIIIGKNGKDIKDLGIKSRQKIEEVFDCKIYLELNVKVRNKWRNDNNLIMNLGYKK